MVSVERANRYKYIFYSTLLRQYPLLYIDCECARRLYIHISVCRAKPIKYVYRPVYKKKT